MSRVGDLGNFIRDQRRNARLSLRNLSHMAGISNPYLSQIERGLRRPSAEILQAIAKALRISAETLYVKAGILEERNDPTDPVTAILRDLSLTEKQKQAMVEIYQSFRQDNDGGTARPGDTTTARAVALQRAAAAPTPTRAPRTAPRAKPARKRSTATKTKGAAARRAKAKKPAKPARTRSAKTQRKKTAARRSRAKKR